MAIDNDHSRKLGKIVQAITENHTQKLRQVVTRLSGNVDSEARDFKKTLVESISNYLELYLEEVMPEDTLRESVANKKAEYMVGELRNMLGVDMALAKDTIKDAIADGKCQIDSANQLNESLSTENVQLKTQLGNAKATVVLEQLSKDLPNKKQKYLQRVLGNKDERFIKENFKYTVALFDKEVQKQTAEIRAEAVRSVKGKVDPIVTENAEVISESVVDDSDDPMFNTYMGELGKY